MTQITTTRAIVVEDSTFFPTKTLSQLAGSDLVTQLQQMSDQLASQTALHKISPLQDVE